MVSSQFTSDTSMWFIFLGVPRYKVQQKNFYLFGLFFFQTRKWFFFL